jgi:tetratricopeptide (TPR) repeat protein
VNSRIYYNLGLIYQYLNNPVKAESSLLKAYSLTPDNFDVIYALADFYIKQSNFTSAMKYANEVKEKFPSNPAGSQLLNFINEQLKK